MAASRTVKSIKNAKWGMILQCVMIVTRFITTTFLIKTLGDEFNGLNGLFCEVISVMSLAEMGVGTAIVYNLYKPLASGDIKTLERLMGLFKSAYRVIGIVMLLLGAALMPFIHLTVKKTAFDIRYIRIVFALFVVKTASTYFLAYKRSILNADQNNYVVSAVTAVFQLAVTAAGAAVLALCRSYIIYLLILIVNEIAINITLSVCADRRYPFLKHTKKALPEEKKAVFSNIKYIFIGTLSGKITTSTDNILISVLISTFQVGIYTNYALILNAVRNILQKIAESLTGSFGNLLVTETEDRIDDVYRRVLFLFSSVGFCAAMALYAAVTPFIKFWLGEGHVLGSGVLYVCVFNTFLFIAREPLWKIVQTSGLFAKDKNISIIGSTVNLAVSIVCAKFWGMTGIFLGTSCTLIIQIVLKTVLFYRARLLKSPAESLFYWLKSCILTALGMALTWYLCSFFELRFYLADCFIKGVMALSAGVLILFVLYGRSSELKFWLNMIKTMVPGRRKLEKFKNEV